MELPKTFKAWIVERARAAAAMVPPWVVPLEVMLDENAKVPHKFACGHDVLSVYRVTEAQSRDARSQVE